MKEDATEILEKLLAVIKKSLISRRDVMIPDLRK
jgi:hypothetical protein